MSLWKNYQEAVFETFPDLTFEKQHVHWINDRGVNLTADLYSGKHFIKSRHVDIWDDKLNIHNNVIYPKTGHNLPCFGMDLMGFFEKKVIIVFDFQHPVEKYLMSYLSYQKQKEHIDFLNLVIISLKIYLLGIALCLR